MSANPPTDYIRRNVTTSSERIQQKKAEMAYAFIQQFEYDQSISPVPLLGPGFRGGGSIDMNAGLHVQAVTAGTVFYNTGGTIQQLLPASAFPPPPPTASISILQLGILSCNWSAHSSSTTYTIELFQDSFSTTPVHTYTEVTGTSLVTSLLEFTPVNGRSYGASVIGDADASGTTPVFTPLLRYSFTASVALQYVGSLLCSWDPHPNATSYTVTVYKTSFSTTPVVYRYTAVTGASLVTAGEFTLVSGTAYGISVVGNNDAAGVPAIFSPSASFVTYPSYTASVSIQSVGSLHCSWTPHPTVSTYSVNIFKDSFNGSPVYTYTTSATVLDTDTRLSLVSGATYGVSVVGNGETPSISTVYTTSFVTNGTYTATIAVQRVGSLRCSWTAHPGVSTYTVKMYQTSTSGSLLTTYTTSGTSLDTVASDFTLTGGQSYGFTVKGDTDTDTGIVSSNFLAYPSYTATIAVQRVGSLRCSWTAHPGVSTYTVKIYQTSTSGNLLTTYTTPATSLDTVANDFIPTSGQPYGFTVKGDTDTDAGIVSSTFVTYPSYTATITVQRVGSLHCSWDSHPGVATYTVKIYQTSTSGNLLTTYTTSGTSLDTVADDFTLTSGQPYGFTVKGNTDTDAGIVSSTFVTYPSYNATIAVQRVGSLRCSWTAHPGVSSYSVSIFQDSFSGSPAIYTYTTSATTLDTDSYATLVSGHSYGFSVKGAGDTTAQSINSSLIPYSFTATVSASNTGGLHIDWDAHPGLNPTTYTVRIDAGTVGNTVWTYTAISGTSLNTNGEFTLVSGQPYSAVITGTGLPATNSIASPFYTYISAGSASISQSVYNSLNLSWAAHPGSTTYMVKLYTTLSNVAVYTYSNITELFIHTGTEITTLLNDTLYYITVSGNADAVGASPSVSPNFLSNTLYPTMTLVSPYTSFVISWNAASGATGYTVQFLSSTTSSTSGGTPINSYTTGVATRTKTTGGENSPYTVVTPTNSTYYYARVRQLGQTEDTSYKVVPSSVYVWGVGKVPTFTLTQNMTTDSVTITWTRDPSITDTYTLSIYDSSSSTAILTYSVGTTTSYTIPASNLTTARTLYASISLTAIPQSISYNSSTISYVKQLAMKLQASSYTVGNTIWTDTSPSALYTATLAEGIGQKNVKGNGILLNGSTYWTLPAIQASTYSFWYKTRKIAPVGSSGAGGLLTQDYSPTNGSYSSCFTTTLTSFSCSNKLNSTTSQGTASITTDGTWTHVLVSNLANAASAPLVWVNGVSVSQTTNGVAASGNGMPFSIGRDTIQGNGTPCYFVGELGEIVAYKSQVTDNVGANVIYTMSQANYYPTPTTNCSMSQIAYNSFHFTWDYIPSYTSYTISIITYIGTTSTPVKTITGITGIEYDTSTDTGFTLLTNTQYYFSIKGVNGQLSSTTYYPTNSSGYIYLITLNTTINAELFPSISLVPSSFSQFRFSWFPVKGLTGTVNYDIKLYDLTVVPGPVLVKTYSSINGTVNGNKLYYDTQLVDITPVTSHKYVFTMNVSANGGIPASASKQAVFSAAYWGSTVSISLGINSFGFLTISWNNDTSLGNLNYTLSIYSSADSSFVTSKNVGKTYSTFISSSFFTIGASYYATLKLTDSSVYIPLPSTALTYSINPEITTAISLRVNADGSVFASWDVDPMPSIIPYTVSIYSSANSTLLTSIDCGNAYSAFISGTFFTIGASYYAILTITGYPTVNPVTSATITYSINPGIFLEASNYSGSGTWFDQSDDSYHAVLSYGTIAKNIAENGIILNGASYWTIPKVTTNTILDASASIINMPNIILSTWTISLWYKSTAAVQAAGPQILTNTNASGPNAVTIGYGTGTNLTGGFYTNSAFVSGTAISLTNGTWTNIVIVRDINSISTYTNGTLVGTIPTTKGPILDESPFYLGRGLAAGSYVTGEIGELRVYTSILSTGSIQALYNSTRATYSV